MDTKRESPRQLGTELLQDLAAKLERTAQEQLGVGSDKARRFATEAVGLIADDWGGQLIYVPMNAVGRRTQRNLQIWREFKGDNHAELATRHNLCVQRVYEIIKAMQRLHAPKQGSLLNTTKP